MLVSLGLCCAAVFAAPGNGRELHPQADARGFSRSDDAPTQQQRRQALRQSLGSQRDERRQTDAGADAMRHMNSQERAELRQQLRQQKR